MKHFKIYTFALAAFFLFSSADLFAQQHKGKRGEKARKEHYKKQEKYRKNAQKHDRHYDKRDHYYAKSHKKYGPPSWAPAHGYRSKHHVYFRDYHTFYDPYRGGYLYHRKNKWIFSRTVPTFLVGINLGSARVHVIDDIPLDRHPELYYSRYSSRYPQDPRIQINVSLF